MDVNFLTEKYKNFIFIGESGGGKSEIALNIAKYISDIIENEVHFFDMDMTKPLFRSRDSSSDSTLNKISFHFEEQFMDAPTMVGGVREHLLDENCYVILDVGGNDTGSRSIGGFSNIIKNDDTAIFYVINPYRPWSDTIEHIDMILSSILNVSHIDLKKLRIISNPNLSNQTTIEDVINGNKKLQDNISKYLKIEFLSIEENVFYKPSDIDVPILPIKRYLKYEWEN